MPTADFWVGPPTAPDTYRLVSLLGGGGEGEVWSAVLQLSAGGRANVAVKILHAEGGPHELEHWNQFGRLLRSLTHPGLVRVTDVFLGPVRHRDNSADFSTVAAYVVMDHIDGPTLREWCDEHPDATASKRLGMLRTVASALDEMHSGASTHVPVAHGDVKPANVVVRDGGGTVLVDLGLARLADAAGTAGRSAAYAAPELRGPTAQATPEADRYAFAVTTAQVLTGQPVPTTPEGWLDPVGLEHLLRANPITQRRPMLIRRILDALTAPPEARPHPLRVWLDSAAETLSQVTAGGSALPPPPRLSPDDAATDSMPVIAPAATTRLQAPPSPPPSPPPSRRRRWPLVLGALVLVAAAIAATAFVLQKPTPTPNPVIVAAPITTTALPPTTTPSSPTFLTDTDTASSATGLPTGPAYLSAMTVVDRDNPGGDTADQNGTFSTSGKQYGHAISMGIGCFNHDGGDYWIDYDLGRQWNTFTTTVGIRDDAPATSKATYTVLLDSKVVANGALTLGTATPITIPVTNGLRLRLKMNNPDPGVQNCNDDPLKTHVVWGDPQVAP